MNIKLFLITATLLIPQIAVCQIDLSAAGLYVAVSDKVKLKRTQDVLTEEILTRTSIKIPVSRRLTNGKGSSIVLVLEEDLGMLPAGLREKYQSLNAIQPEGFKIFSDESTRTVVIAGKDERGLLYGTGRFLRKVELSANRIYLPEHIAMATSPRYPIRGHQLGYRPKTNSYDAFTVAQFDRYIRDLALFGANSIEIMPPRTDDKFTSQHMKIPAIEMVREQSRICKEYGLDVWMWYPNLEKNYHDPLVIEKELAEREEVFRTLPKLDAVFAPGGDPGDLEPDELFEWMGRVAVLLHQYHPEAKVWISPQSFRPDKAWFDSFFDHVNKGYPWLGGIVFGPWVKVPVEEIRQRVRADIPIRNYPDITHSLACQYPVPDWDMAWAVTLGREAVNPRPNDQKLFHNAVAPYCVGSLSYSEGTNDDVNKFIWSDQDWDPQTDVMETLKDYSRLFFGPEFAYRGAVALAALEENHHGELLTKRSVAQTLRQWQALESEAAPALLSNPRFQMGQIRAYYDEYTRQRLVYETNIEERALELLENGLKNDIQSAIVAASGLLKSAWKSPVKPDLRQKCLDLADSLYRSIGAQLTIEKHGAMPGRGNFIDNIQFPLNDAPWLLSQLEQIKVLSDTKAQKEKVSMLLSRTNPGPGGFYDHLADPDSRHRIVSSVSWKDDPGSLSSPRTGFGITLPDKTWYGSIEGIGSGVPMAPRNWNNQVEALYGTPLRVRYENLDKEATYRIRIAYTGRFKSTLKLTSGEGILIHDDLKVGQQPLHEFEVPREVTGKGSAEFVWTCKEAERGAQVSEIWLIRVEN